VQSEYQKGSTFIFSIEDKTPVEIRSSSHQHSQKYSQFSPYAKLEANIKEISSPDLKTLSRASTGEYSLREAVLKNQTKASTYLRKVSLLTRLESSEVITDFACHQNPTVHFDFNNVSSQLIESNQRPQNGSKRLPITIHELETASKRYPKESNLYVERLRRATLQPEKSSRSLMSSPVCSCYQVIAVDDEPMNLMALKLMCIELGIGIKCFNRGDEAIEYFNKGEQKSKCMKCKGPVLVLMDCNMPEKDGFETSKELQQLMDKGKMPQIPILACSADDSPMMRSTVIEKGMNGCLPKPVQKIKLQSLVNFYGKNVK